jgi:Ca2+-binding RTX toxin-like protein
MAILMGTSGPDTFMGTTEADTMFAAGGNDTVNGNIGNDKIYGELGNDSLRGSAGLDSLYGGEGDDTLDASGEGNDYLFGGSNNDVYQIVRFGSVVIEEPYQGTDTIRSSVGNITYLEDNVENLVLTGTANINGIGNQLHNVITGNSGNNTLEGLVGNDILDGGIGNDIINGGFGNDNLTGGANSDQFLFEVDLPGGGVDTITDFSIAAADKMLLDKSLFELLETGAGNPLAAFDFSVINVAAASEVAIAGGSVNEIVYNIQTGSLFYNPNNSVSDFGATGGKFATIVGSPDNLSHTNFFVVP